MKNRLIEKIKSKNIEILSIVSVILIWEFVADFIVRNSFYMPSFHSVILAFIQVVQSGSFFSDSAISLYHFAGGFLAALIIGIPLGVAMGWYPKINRAISPIVETLRPIPPLAWIPFAIIWLKLTHTAAAFIIFMGMVFPIILNTYSGFKNIPKVYVEAAKVLGCTDHKKLIRYIAIPSASPSILSGIRISMGVGWMCLAASEMFGVSDSGIGYKIWFYYGIQRMDYVVVYMLVLGLLGLLLDFLFRHFVQERILKWQKGTVI
ncbi:ABC transporter permease [Methanolapillus ohkumae]|uniref:Bicarbonate transport system permease protein CmpB n=1 Tax=Methanolapillus ohkumae TaxID=3028298 RepID=A0AA96ZXR8_9EURY|nr:Bicarbonate transport system permease protein CmpB [Methanosarcinaceae archaeon Am2]